MAHLVAAHLNTPPPRPSTTQPNVPAQVDACHRDRYGQRPRTAVCHHDRAGRCGPRRHYHAHRPAKQSAHGVQPDQQPRPARLRPQIAAPRPTGRSRPSHRRPGGARRTTGLIVVASLSCWPAPAPGAMSYDRHPSASHAATLSGPTARPASPASRPPVPATELADLLLSPNNLAVALGAWRHERDGDLHRHGHRHHNGPGVRQRRSDGVEPRCMHPADTPASEDRSLSSDRITSSFSTWCRFARLMMRARSSPPPPSSGQPAPASAD